MLDDDAVRNSYLNEGGDLNPECADMAKFITGLNSEQRNYLRAFYKHITTENPENEKPEKKPHPFSGKTKAEITNLIEKKKSTEVQVEDLLKEHGIS